MDLVNTTRNTVNVEQILIENALLKKQNKLLIDFREKTKEKLIIIKEFLQFVQKECIQNECRIQYLRNLIFSEKEEEKKEEEKKEAEKENDNYNYFLA